MMPDGNLLIAFKWLNHEHHETARAFFARHVRVVTCPITELNLTRRRLRPPLQANCWKGFI